MMPLRLKLGTPILVLAPSTLESCTRGIHDEGTMVVVIFNFLAVRMGHRI